MRIAGHRTSIALEVDFWAELEKQAKLRGTTLPKLLAEIDSKRAQETPNASLASSVRVFALLNRKG